MSVRVFFHTLYYPSHETFEGNFLSGTVMCPELSEQVISWHPFINPGAPVVVTKKVFEPTAFNEVGETLKVKEDI